MSMWQFFAMLSGQVDSKDGLSAAETDELWDWLKEKDMAGGN